MAIIYAWNFPRLVVNPSMDGLTDVVTTVHWTLTAVDGDYSSYCYGSVGLPAPGISFTDFQNLTKDQVTEWVKTQLNNSRTTVAQIEENLSNQIASQKNPTAINVPPPFPN